MEDKYKLIRFLEAQNQMYLEALSEIKKGQKQSHWMWFIFPQVKGLGSSDTANFYGITGIAEATAYLGHPVLGKHLIEISTATLAIKGKSALDIFGYTDQMKLQSSMTLFSQVAGADLIFGKVLDYYFSGEYDINTLKLLNNP